MSATVTVTGKVMGGLTQTAKVYSNPRSAELDFTNQLIKVTQTDGVIDSVDISAATTLTGTISGATYTLVVS